MNFNEGMKIILLLKLNNYLFEKNIIDKKKQKIILLFILEKDFNIVKLCFR